MRHLALLALLTACSTTTTTTEAGRTFDACEPVWIDAAAADAVQLDSIDAASNLWGALGVAVRATSSNAPALEIVFKPAGSAFHGYFDGVGPTIYINDGLDGDEQIVTLAHELGHAFGLSHVDPNVRTSVMNPGNLSILPTGDDRLEIERLWGICAP